MQLREKVVVACSPEQAFDLVDDLATYHRWLTIVASARPEPTGANGAAWEVELRGRVGPLARSKRLRMVRTKHQRPARVRFERRELDGRDHAPWELTVEIQPDSGGASVTMELHYGGRFANAVIERMLRDEVTAARDRLVALAAAA
ncbi:MAG: SRPBCC family protein [Acidimicrobiia bacterium]|nr:SRPBCC family protein [Acidimicrobiia bacterium]